MLSFLMPKITPSLRPYIIDGAVYFLAGIEPRQKYAFNANLKGVEFKDLKEPAVTVMLYTGRNEHLEFPFDGSGIVAFTDGTVKVVEHTDNRKPRWKP